LILDVDFDNILILENIVLANKLRLFKVSFKDLSVPERKKEILVNLAG